MKEFWLRNKCKIIPIITFLIGVILCFIVTHIPWQDYNPEYLGNAADWVGGIGTIIAVIVAYYQIIKEQ